MYKFLNKIKNMLHNGIFKIYLRKGILGKNTDVKNLVYWVNILIKKIYF